MPNIYHEVISEGGGLHLHLHPFYHFCLICSPDELVHSDVWVYVVDFESAEDIFFVSCKECTAAVMAKDLGGVENDAT